MKHCDKCNIDIASPCTVCPLCQSELKNVEGKLDKTFPPIITPSINSHLLFRILGFVSILTILISLIINIIIPSNIFWSLFVIVGVCCSWISLIILIVKRKALVKNIMWQFLFVCIFSLIWDYITGWHNWSITYVIPISVSCCIIGIFVLAIALHLNISDYLLYLFLLCILGLGATILIKLKIVATIIPSFICVIISIFYLCGIICFGGSRMIGELKRRLHV